MSELTESTTQSPRQLRGEYIKASKSMEDKLHFPSSLEFVSSHPEASFELRTGGFCRGVLFFFASAYILLNLGQLSPQRVWELNSLIPKKGLGSSFLCAPEIQTYPPYWQMW